MASLQDQLLNAGLAKKADAKKIKRQKHKAKKLQQTQKVAVVDEAKLAAEAAVQAKKEKDAQIAAEQARLRAQKELVAQVKQLIQSNIQSFKEGDIPLNFTDENFVKRLYVTEATQKLVVQARLAIAKHADGYVLILTPVADKIAQRLPEFIVYRADDTVDEATSEQDDWYADYDIPDELVW